MGSSAKNLGGTKRRSLRGKFSNTGRREATINNNNF